MTFLFVVLQRIGYALAQSGMADTAAWIAAADAALYRAKAAGRDGAAA